MAKSKKEIKRAKQRQLAAKRKHRQLPAAASDEPSFAVDAVHAHPPSMMSLSTDRYEESDENPEIDRWWTRFDQAAPNDRIQMVIDVLSEPLDEQWQRALFPESVYDAEPDSDPERYVALLQRLADEHPELYRTGGEWFLQSWIAYLLATGNEAPIANIVSKHAEHMSVPGEAFFGVVPMLRLASLESAADELVAAGLAAAADDQLMPWAMAEVREWLFSKYLRTTVEAGGDADAIADMERQLEARQLNTTADVASLRSDIVRRTTGTGMRPWKRSELVGGNKNSNRNCELLGFEFAGWLHRQSGLCFSAADELRILIAGTINDDKITMRDYLDGVSREQLDRSLASQPDFTGPSSFKLPAMLIAVDWYAKFLHQHELSTEAAMQKTRDAVSTMEAHLQQLMQHDWPSFRFLDRLRQPTG